MSNFPLFFHRLFPFSCYFFTSDLKFSTQHQKWCSHIHNRTGKTWYASIRLQMFFKISVLKISQTSQENTFVGVSATWLRPCNIFKKILQYRCFPATFVKLLRTPFLTEHLRWLFLVIISLTPDSLPWLSLAYYQRFYRQ